VRGEELFEGDVSCDGIFSTRSVEKETDSALMPTRASLLAILDLEEDILEEKSTELFVRMNAILNGLSVQ
jgi:hypothetical protein